MSKKLLSFQLPKAAYNKEDSSIIDTGFPYMDTTTKRYTNYETYNVIAVNCNVIVSTVILKKTKKNNYKKCEPTRPRNKFIIARNFVSCLLRRLEITINSQVISKIVSEIWKNSGKNFINYFEYLAIFDNNLHHQIFDNDFLRFKTKKTINKKHFNTYGDFTYEVPEDSHTTKPQTLLIKSRKEYLDLCKSSLAIETKLKSKPIESTNSLSRNKLMSLPLEILNNPKSKRLDFKQPMFSKFSISSGRVHKQNKNLQSSFNY